MPGKNADPIVWLDGALVAASEARLSPFDAGFTVGHGAFETLITYGRKPFAAGRHWRRLQRSCEGIGFPAPDEALVRRAMKEVVAANSFAEARLRVTVTAGEPSSSADRRSRDGVLVVTCVDRPHWPPTARVVIVPWPRNEKGSLSGLKTTSYAENVVALGYARSRQADEAVFLNTRGHLCEGTGSNIFVIKNGRLFTPPLTSGCLAGVTRELVLELAQQADLPLEESDLDRAALSNADEGFLTSTTREIHPIAAVDGRPLACGDITAALQQAWRRLVAKAHDEKI